MFIFIKEKCAYLFKTLGTCVSLDKFILLSDLNFGSEVDWLAKDSEGCKFTAHDFGSQYITERMIDYRTSFSLTIAHWLGIQHS